MKTTDWMKKLAYGITLVLSLPLAFAKPGTENFVKGFSSAGQFLEQLFKSEYAVFGLGVLFTIVMFYNIFVPLIGKIPVFAGDGKNAANKYGRLVALCISILAALGIFGVLYLTNGVTSVREIIDSMLGVYATLAGMVVAFVMFGIIYFGFGSLDQDERWKRAILGTGAALVAIGTLLARPGLYSLGWLLVFIMLLILLGKKWSGDGGSGGGKSGEKKKGKVKLKGKVVDATGKPQAGKRVAAIDSSGSELAGASTLGNGKFTITIGDIEDKEVTVADVIAGGDASWNAYNGAKDHKGKEPPFKIKKDKEQEDIIVSPGNELSGAERNKDGDGENKGGTSDPFEWYPEIIDGTKNPAKGKIYQRP
jgi:hypothetical protein